MNQKLKAVLIVVAIAVAAVAVTYVVAQAVYSQSHPSNGTVITMNLQVTLDSTVLADGDPIAWGNIEPDTEYSKTLRIDNIGETSATLDISTINLPTGWTCGSSLDGYTITPGNSATGTLTLTPDDSVTGAQSWTTMFAGA